MERSNYGQYEHTTGCRPASAAPTVRPQKPDSVIGLSITLFSPKRSNKPFVTLYLLMKVSSMALEAELNYPAIQRRSIENAMNGLLSLYRVNAVTYAPLYWATSSPSTKTLSLDSSSSANASFKASLTATSFTPLGVAYSLRLTRLGNETLGCRDDWVGAVQGREAERRREAGRRRREGTMTRAIDCRIN